MKIFILLVIVFNGINIKAQDKIYFIKGKVSSDTKFGDNQVDSILGKALDSLFVIHDLNYRLEIVDGSRGDDIAKSGQKFIRIFTAFEFISDTTEKDNLNPLLILKKRGWDKPFYYSYFIARDNSQFQTLEDVSKINTIYLQRGSISGYYSPLYCLWESNVIKNPSVLSLENEKKIRVVLLNSSQSVIDSVNTNLWSIGATGEEIFTGFPRVEIKTINQILPQDLICISSNLNGIQDKLDSVLEELIRSRALDFSGMHITGFDKYNNLYINSYNFITAMVEIVNKSKTQFDESIYLKRVTSEKISISDLIIFLSHSNWAVFVSLVSCLTLIYIFGFNTGKFVLPLVEKIKNLFKYNPK